MSRPTTTAGREQRARENAAKRAAGQRLPGRRPGDAYRPAAQPAPRHPHPAVDHITKRVEVELVRWKTGTAEYDLVSGILLGRTPEAFILASDGGPVEYLRAEWLLCEADDESEAA